MHVTHMNFAKGFRGGERQTVLLIEALARYGIDQTLVVRKDSAILHYLRDLSNLHVITTTKPYIRVVPKLPHSTILHAHETKAAQSALIASLVRDLPYVVTRRVDNTVKNNLFNRLLYERAAACVALSQAIAQTITDVASPKKLTVIPSAYTPKAHNEAFTQTIRKNYQGKFLVGHVGALDDRHKGQSLILQAAKSLQHTHPQIFFLLVGGGRDEQRLKTLAQGLSNVEFVGFVDNVLDYIAAFDLFVFPSRNEGLGSTLLDVMRLGVPIVASKVGGIPEIITHRHNGLLIAPNDANALTQAIIRLYENDALRNELASAGLASIERFSAENMARRYYELYGEIIANTKSKKV